MLSSSLSSGMWSGCGSVSTCRPQRRKDSDKKPRIAACTRSGCNTHMSTLGLAATHMSTLGLVATHTSTLGLDATHTSTLGLVATHTSTLDDSACGRCCPNAQILSSQPEPGSVCC
eukprot:364938-Chlamydomonas_euryale.AAC.16